MKWTPKVLIPVVIVVLAAVGVSVIAHRGQQREILGSGIIEADEVQISPKIGGRLEKLLVREGQQVEPGQLIAALEHADVDAEMQRAEGAAQAAQAALRELERGSRREQIEAARARLAQARAGRRGAERDLETAQEAHEKVTELKQKLDAARAGVQAAQANVAAAKANLDEARAGPTEEQINTLRAALKQAEARVESARKAARNAEEVYQHQAALETPLIAAATEESVGESEAALAQSESGRVEALAAADAATPRALDQARTQEAAAEARLDGARRAVADAQEQVALTRAQAKLKRDAAADALEEAVRAREAARAQLNVLLAGTREERVRAAEAALAAAETEADAAQATLQNTTELYEDRLAARQKRDAAEASLESALALERAARAELDLLLAGNTKEAIDHARGRLAEAQGALQAAEVRRSYCDLHAPCAGTVTEVVADEGEVVNPGAAVLVLADLENIWLRAYLGFAKLGAITLGQTLRVVTEAVPGRDFEGKVTRISDEAEFTPKDVQTAEQRVRQVYWIKVWLGDGEGLLKPGMPADVLP